PEVGIPDQVVGQDLASVPEPRLYHSTSLVLPDGRVVVGGGGSLPGTIDHRNLEYFSPPYLFKGPRPTISSAPDQVDYGQTLTIRTPPPPHTPTLSLIPTTPASHTPH